MQPKLETRKRASKELKSTAVEVLFTGEQRPNEWHALLEKCSYCKTLRVAGWVLKFKNKSLVNKQGMKKTKGPLTTEEI